MSEDNLDQNHPIDRRDSILSEADVAQAIKLLSQSLPINVPSKVKEGMDMYEEMANAPHINFDN